MMIPIFIDWSDTTVLPESTDRSHHIESVTQQNSKQNAFCNGQTMRILMLALDGIFNEFHDRRNVQKYQYLDFYYSRDDLRQRNV